MNWNISHDGRVTRLDNGPKRPWWWKNVPKHDNGGDGSGIRTRFRNASDTQPGTGSAAAADDGTATRRQ